MKRGHLLKPAGALSLAAAPFTARFTAALASNTTLKNAHPLPDVTASEGDFRDRLVRPFAAGVDKRMRGAPKMEMDPGSERSFTLCRGPVSKCQQRCNARSGPLPRPGLWLQDRAGGLGHFCDQKRGAPACAHTRDSRWSASRRAGVCSRALAVRFARHCHQIAHYADGSQVI
jgi:hypothetical protein